MGDAVAIVDFLIDAMSVRSEKYNNAVTTANQRQMNNVICSRHHENSNKSTAHLNVPIENVRSHVGSDAQH